jgi:hypothetical protein
LSSCTGSFPSPPLEKNDEEGRYSPSLSYRWHDVPEYSEDDRPELEVRETRRDVHSSNTHIMLVKKDNTQAKHNPNVFTRKATDNFGYSISQSILISSTRRRLSLLM